MIDTNVIVSSFLSKGSIPDQVVDQALKGLITPLLSDDILKEYREVLERNRFQFDKNRIEDFLTQ